MAGISSRTSRLCFLRCLAESSGFHPNDGCLCRQYMAWGPK